MVYPLEAIIMLNHFDVIVILSLQFCFKFFYVAFSSLGPCNHLETLLLSILIFAGSLLLFKPASPKAI